MRGPLHSIIVLIIALLLFFSGCQTIPQKKPLTDYEKMRLRQDIILEFYRAWRLKQDEREFLNERNRDGTENIPHKESGPGSGTRSRSLQSQGTARGLANQQGGKGAGKAGACVETQESKTPENKKAEIEKSQKGKVG